MWRLVLGAIVVVSSVCAATPPPPPTYDVLHPDGRRIYTPAKRLAIRDQVVEMFYHGYKNYMTHAFPQDELKPLSCKGSNVFGGYALTLIDSLDMLALIGDDEEFFKQIRYVGANVKFDANLKVSVFETTIRILGGLLSAHLLALQSGPRLRARTDIDDAETKFAYDGGLLKVAVAVAEKLMPAFNTPTGIPFNEIHLQRGVNKADGHASCPAAAGSLLLEFGLLTQLTGDCRYLTVARRAFLGVWRWRSMHQVVGTMIDIFSGSWINTQVNIGASVDSFYEYMFKAYIVFDDDEYYQMWLDAYKGVQKYTYFGGWYLTATVENANGPIENYDHQINALQAFWPGLQAIAGETDHALDSYEKMLCVVRSHVFMPEYLGLRAFLERNGVGSRNGPGYPLRPEFIESTYFLHRSTGDDTFLAIAHNFMAQLARTRVSCGFAAILDIYSMAHEDKMDSFMLAETLKYLYLIFTPTDAEMIRDNLRGRGANGVPNKERPVLPFGLEMGFVVNTEAHPVPINKAIQEVHRKCGAKLSIPDSLNNPSFINFNQDKFTIIRENFGRTEFELKRQCPVIDYMRDVAPFLDRLRSPAKHCYRTDFVVVPLRASKQASTTSSSFTNNQVPQPPAYVGYTLSIVNDPFNILAIPNGLVRTLTVPVNAPTLRIEQHNSVTIVSPQLAPQSLFIQSEAVLRFAIPSLGVQGGYFAKASLFGAVPCGHQGGGPAEGPPPEKGPDTPISAVSGPLYVASGLLCPNRDGTFHDQHLGLRHHVRGDIPSSVWAANFSDGRHPHFGILVARGSCTFIEKRHVATLLGAAFVIVVNTERALFNMAPAEGLPFKPQGANVPIFLIASDAGAKLAELFTVPSSIAPVDAALAAPGIVEVVCTVNAIDQFQSLGIVVAQSSALERLFLLPASLHMPTAYRSMSLLTAAYEYAARSKSPRVNDLTLSADVASYGVTFLDYPTPAPPIDNTVEVQACTRCKLVVAVDGLHSDREAVQLNRGAQGIHSSLRFAGELGRLSVQVRMAYASEDLSATDGIATAHYAAAQYVDPWLFHRLPEEGALWGIATVAVVTLADDVNLERFDSHMADMQRWLISHGAEAGISARYVGFSASSRRKFIEVFVYDSKEAMEAFTRDDWHALPTAHDGHVLQAILLSYRHRDKAKTSSATEFETNEAVFVQHF